MASLTTAWLRVIALLTLVEIVCASESKVNSISPTVGSIAGGTRLTISGSGFSPDPFSFGAGNEDKGNLVFLRNPFYSLQCDVLAYLSNTEKIVCDTRSLKEEGTFSVFVIVDGVPVTRYCNRVSSCKFEYRGKNTPTISSVTPISGVPGTRITIRGQIITDVYDPSKALEDEDDIYEDKSNILRVYWGSYFCDPINPETGEFYNIALDSQDAYSGVIECVPQGTFIASQSLTFLVSDEYGHSATDKGILQVSGQNKLYLFQAHADILDVSPKLGSTRGGTVLTITGRYFDELDTVVLVGGVPCEIFNISTTEILCVTGPAPLELSSYPGGRGMKYEIWKDTSVSLDNAVWNTSASDYSSSLVLEASSTPENVLGEADDFVSRLTGYFVPPHNGGYQFFVRGDDVASLLLSTNGSAEDLTEIAYISRPRTNWEAEDSQASEKITLIGGQSYYIEARHRANGDGEFVQVGYTAFNVPLNTFNTSAATNEVQDITTTSIVHQELQTLAIDGGSYETQEIYVELPSCPTTVAVSNESAQCDESGVYRLQFDGQTTGDINVTASAAEVEAALNLILDPETVGVKKSSDSNSNTYTVEFHIAQEGIALMTVDRNDSNLVVTVTRIKSYAPVELIEFTLLYDGISSMPLSSNSTAEQVESALLEMFSVKCSLAGSVKGYYVQDFEAGNLGWIDGEVVNNQEPYCGRWSVKNPNHIFYAGRTAVPGSSKKIGSFDVRVHDQLCFGHRGDIQSRIQVRIQWIDEESTKRNIWRYLTDNNLQSSESWTYTCVDMGTLIQSTDVYTQRLRRTALKISRIRLFRVEGQDLFVDNVYIGSKPPQYVREQRAASPNGIFVLDASVTSNGFSYNITLTPSNCGYDFPLLQIMGANVSANGSELASYSSDAWPADTVISVKRQVAATLPIEGTFQIELYGVNFTVPAQATADQLKEALQANLDIGSLEVSREGSCSSYSWDVEYLSKGGSQPLIKVNGSELMGLAVGVTAHRVEEGHVFVGPIPGEFLRVAHPRPQVEVIVNKIPSSCSEGQCSFQYNDSVTPKITSSTPANGSAYHGTVLTLSGSGFGTNTNENNVTIGGVVCDVTSFNETFLSCSVGQAAAGLYNVSLMVEGPGYSDYPNGPITFKYELGVTNVSPTAGSTAGGTRVTITGYGFSEKIGSISASFGSKPCIIDTITYDEIQCVIAMDTEVSRRKRRSIQVDLIIVVASRTFTEQDVFTFDPSLTPTIQGISPNVSRVQGGGVLVISGSSFGSSGASVTIGKVDCPIIGHEDGQINCTIPEHAPGTYQVLLEVSGQGFAEANGMKFKYMLEATGLFPSRGSIQGGTVVTVTGAGFGSNASDVAVSMGGIECTVESVADDSIQCVTTTSEVTHYVDNFGKHQLYGVGYKWNPQVLSVTAGDIVAWRWAVQQQVTGIGYAVMETADADAVQYDGKGFFSGKKSPNGAFAYRFSTPGIYFYSSGPVDEDETLFMRGTIKVHEPTTTSVKLLVTVAGYDALHDTESGVTEPASSDGCPGSDMAIPSCTVPPAEQPDDSSFYYSYWACSTPIVDGFNPKVGTPDQLINITGVGFRNTLCENKISFGDYSCVPQSATNVSMTCLLDTAGGMPVGEPLAISLVVKNLGLALVQVPTPVDLGFTLKPQIDVLSVHSGAMTGGTEIVISGDGFSSGDISVWIGSSGCTVRSVAYTQVVCVTTPGNAGSAELQLQINSQGAYCNGDCSFEFSEAMTPVVDAVSPSTVSGPSTLIQISGVGFVDVTSDVAIAIAEITCVVMAARGDQIDCEVGYVPVGDQEIIVNIAAKGNALFNTSNVINSAAVIFGIYPNSGSTEGGQTVTILGSGFVDGSSSVDIGGADCVVQSVSLGEIVCLTSDHAAGTVNLVVTSQGVDYPVVSYEYAAAETPTITSVSPGTGVTGDSITISGSYFSTNTSNISVSIDGALCAVSSAAVDAISCTLGPHSAGTYPVVVYVEGKGLSASDTTFEYVLTVSSVSPAEGSFGGGLILSIDGAGFDETAVVMVCTNSCPISSSTSSLIECEVPANSGSSSVVCDVTVTLASGATATVSDAFTYKSSLTPVIDSVEPQRGGTAGGTSLTVTGLGFQSSGNVVTIGGSVCTVQSESTTEIICETGAHSPPEMTKVRVEVGSNGIATQDNADFYYIDVWSSRYTWGNQDPPIEGDFVVVPAGQTLLLDVTTPILTMLLIQGGSVIFDEADIELHAENILIVDNGLLQVGTEEKPFQHDATIMMHGHVRSTELPLFGAKTLAVRNGTLDLHGKPVPITWTRLAQTAPAAATQMVLEKSVTWKAWDQIVIASTGHRHSQTQNEFLTITAVSADGTVLDFEPPLEYEHYGFTQDVEGVMLEMRAEVGMLTRNVKFRGSVQEEWTETIEACPAEFDTNQFATQTCFQGRFGEETGSDQFGAQMMLFARYQNEQLVTGRIEYVEVTHAGQAFRLGRYPIHFHLNGNVSGSYVRGCGIHHTFNRAVTIHAVHNLLVEHNVAYNILGHAYFLEDGIETGNIIQYNLGVFVRPSSSLLNVDITPATFWVTNPDNIVRHNAAAGGSHFGFWYNMPTHPGGPSFTSSICPRNVPLGEFRNNSAHAQGWYGLWIFPSYHPKVGGGCNAWEDEPAKYYSLYAWEVERGAEAVDVGAIQFHDFLVADADKAGVEYQTVSAQWGSSLVKNLTVIGYSNISEANKSEECTEAGIQAPKADGLIVDGTKFINFDQPRCAALRACAHCKVDQGGFSLRTRELEFLNSPNKAGFKWQHECWFDDLDGTLTGTADYMILPSNPNLPPDHCGEVAAYSVDFSGSYCDATIHLHRFAFNNALPSSLLYKNVLFTNEHGTSSIPYHKKRITHPKGWMVTLIDGDNYNMIFEDVDHVTNISYTGTFYNFDDGEFVLVNHNFTQRPDKFATTGVIKNSTEIVPTYVADDNGDWHFDNDTRIFTYIVSGKGETEPVNRNIDLDVYQCFFKDCLKPVPDIPEPPPEGRPDDARMWSDPASWHDVEDGWSGALNGSVHDVMIIPSVWMVADVQLPVMNKLFIYGGLEMSDTLNHTLEATYILIQGGRLVIGFSESNPFQHEMKILLNGHHFTPDQPLPNGPNLGSKALGVFGGLDIHGKNRSVYWTQLLTTVNPGANTLTVRDQTDWQVGDEIVLATTSYEAWQTETFKIEAVTDASTFQINGSFAFKHLAEYNSDFVLAAEVGLLTRNVKIEGNDYDILFDESFGARVLVGQFFQDGVQYKGDARISNVEFYHSGQEGWSDFFDPRYSLAFLDVGEITDDVPSFVRGCSFHNGFSPAIGVFGTDGLVVQDNVIHHTVGSAIIVRDNNQQLIHNLVTLVVFPGTYQDRFESENLEWNAGIEVDNAGKILLVNNTVAGSERVAYKIKGEACFDPPNPLTDWSGNVGHSTLHGIHMHLSTTAPCTKIANFLLYKSWDFGIYYQSAARVLISGMTLVDNKMAIMPLILQPSALTHVTSDKFFRIQNSLIVGVSNSFDCTNDNVEPENARQSNTQRAPRASGGGHVGLCWPAFASTANLAPFMAFHPVSSYPTINGVSQLQNVDFRGYGEHCGRTDAMIMTNPAAEDASHPIELSGVTMTDVTEGQKIFINRPNLGSVNPSDCVDMDCDGQKKAILRDLDGSFLGSPGTVIPQAEFEWDGNPQRGLGDYRIPKVMLTRPDGSRIPVDDKAPNKGIYRGDSNECEWKGSWQAYECHGIDHMMLVVESMDADTEVRRLTPLAMYTDGYVDLINGPQDNGWCHGYTCQERISTLYTVVATSKDYEVYFTSTNPQVLRFHLLNSDDSQAVVLGIWYANPQRLDVYYKNLYVTPTNADYSTGELTLKAKDPLLPANQYHPSVSSSVHGENYFERDTQTLWVLVRGPEPVEIRTTAVIVVTFGVPAIGVDDFYEDANLIANLAALLKVDQSQIRVVNVVSESSRRRRRAVSGEAEVTVEIGPQPVMTVDSPGSDTGNQTSSDATTPAPSSSPTMAPGASLDYDHLLEIQEVLADTMQSGGLSDALNITVTSLLMTDPVPEVVDPTDGMRATNETGGSSDVPNGTKTYDEVQKEEDENANLDVQVEYREPVGLRVYIQPGGAREGAVLTQQPAVYAVDGLGAIIPRLGAPSSPWKLTATISPSTPNADAVWLTGNTTVPFDGSFANFTDLAIAAQTAGVVLDFRITSPNTSSLVVTAEPFDVAVRPYYLVVASVPDSVFVKAAFDVIVELRDEITMALPQNLSSKGLEWHAAISLSMPTNYRGRLLGQLEATFDLATSRARFANLSVDAAGVSYILMVSVDTRPASSYQLSLTLDPFDVVDPGTVNVTGPTRRLVLRFTADYDTAVAGREDLLKINFLNYINGRYAGVAIGNVLIERGSVLISFDMQGDVDAALDKLWTEVQGGRFSLEFDGRTLEAEPYLLVDGGEYGVPTTSEPPAAFPIWAIAVIVVVVLLVLLIVALVVIKICCKRDKKTSLIEEVPLAQESFKLKDFERSGSFSNPLLKLNNEPNAFDPTGRESPNTPRRTPEIQVTSLPPGYNEPTGQVERMLEDRVKMMVMVKNPDGTFQKLGAVEANKVGTARALREDVKRILPGKLKENKFILLDETLSDIDGAREKKAVLSEIYRSDCVLMRWVKEQDVAKLCVCGLVGQFECSLCRQQTYCSPQCQSTDWVQHSMQCSSHAVASVDNQRL